MKEHLKTSTPELTRREFLKSITALGGAALIESMVIPPALAQQFERGALRRFPMRENTAYDKNVIDQVLHSKPKKAGELTDEEIQNVAGLAQRLYAEISGNGAIQSELARNFPHINKQIEFVITNTSSLVDAGTARFGHVPRAEGLSRLYISADRPAASLPLTLLHELTHAAYGTGEVRAQSMTVLGGLKAIAGKLVGDVEALIDSEDLLILWSQDFRHRFYTSRMREIESSELNPQDVRYRYLPALLFTVLRSTRLSGRPLNRFKTIEGVDRNFEQRLTQGLTDLMKESKDPLVGIEAIMLGYISECADIIREYNPKVQLPSVLQQHEARKR